MNITRAMYPLKFCLMLTAWLCGWFQSLAAETADLPAGAAPRTEVRMPTLELDDQFRRPHRIQFPHAKLTVLVVADRRGSDQVEGWVRAVRDRHGETVDLLGVASLRAVPRLLRASVRRRFVSRSDYPILMDWDNRVASALDCVDDVSNVFVLDRDGRVALRIVGEATEPRRSALSDFIAARLVSRPRDPPDPEIPPHP